ncbi:MAG TPA: DUF1549 domain-containing protein [Gemmataceae bacterium]|jgi:hypothetical protein|nr:DUF1549 domain-containing protein [Gemmataceae bacterium]
MRLLPGDRLFAVLFASLCTAPAVLADGLSDRIDSLIAAGHRDYAANAAPIAGDDEFLRRATLDLSGRVPTATEIRTFLADRSPLKRVRAIDSLLASAECARRLEQYFDVMLMERRRDGKVTRAAWEEFLRSSFAANKPYDVLVREILSADGTNPATRGAAKFFLDRDLDPQIVTRDIARLFFGHNIQCSQCHDHPLVEDYKQDEYFGIQAFFNRTFLFPNSQAPTAVIAEKAEGEVSFTSVFDKAKLVKSTAPRVPGRSAVPDPKIEKGKEYAVAPARDVRPVPNYSRFARLATTIATGDNTAFRRTAANRWWAFLMGRGLIHPLDQDHTANPPSHPELLELLADEFAAHKFDVKWLLREIAMSRTYQRSSEPVPSSKDLGPDRFAVAPLKPLTPEQFAYALMQATGFTDAERTALGANFSDAALHARLAPNAAPFLNVFGARPGETEDKFAATLDQTLFLKHGGTVRNLIAPRAGSLVDRAAKLTDVDALADELFLSVLTRLPTTDERKDVADALKTVPNRSVALTEVVWALVASAEFRFNH